MPNRTAKFVSAIFASLLAGVPSPQSYRTARRARPTIACPAPKDQTPDGSHWYYRIEHATNRHCWYLREEGERPSQTAAPNSRPLRKTGCAESRNRRRSVRSRTRTPNCPPQPRVEQTAAASTRNGRSAAGGCGERRQRRSLRTCRTQRRSDRSSRRAGPIRRARASAVSPQPAAERSGRKHAAESSRPPAQPAAVAAVPLAAADASPAKTVRLDADAADRGRRRAGACGPHGKRRSSGSAGRRGAAPDPRAPARDLGSGRTMHRIAPSAPITATRMRCRAGPVLAREFDRSRDANDRIARDSAAQLSRRAAT